MDIKLKLSTYYFDLLNQISNYSPEIKEYKNINCNEIDISELFEYIKHLTSMIIDTKISAVTSHYYQLENYTKKLEKDLKILYQQIFEYKIQTNSLEDKIKVYKIIQQEYEELKEKVKFFGGKFLDNDRKENEILILRQENEIIKKELAKYDKMNQLNETLKSSYITKINELHKEIEKLNKKLESKLNISNNINNYNTSNAPSVNININNHDNNLLSKLLGKPDINEMKNILVNNINHKKNYKYLKGLKKIFQKTTYNNNKRQNNINITKNIYLNSNSNLKYNINCSTVTTLGQNIFTSNINKISSNERIKKAKNHKNKKLRNSISMKVDKDEYNKSFSLNKYIKIIHNRHNIYKSENKNKKSFSKTKNNFKPAESCPMSCQNKGSSKVRKFLNKNLGFNNCNTYYGKKFKKSSSALNINIIPK